MSKDPTGHFKHATILTSEEKDGIIKIKTAMDGLIETHFQEVIDTKNKMVRDGLTKLGWASPEMKVRMFEAVKEYAIELAMRCEAWGERKEQHPDWRYLQELNTLIAEVEGTK